MKGKRPERNRPWNRFKNQTACRLLGCDLSLSWAPGLPVERTKTILKCARCGVPEIHIHSRRPLLPRSAKTRRHFDH